MRRNSQPELFIVLFILLCNSFIFPKPAYAQVTFGENYANGHIGNSVRQTSDFGYIMLGGEDNYDMWSYNAWGPLGSIKNADVFLMKTNQFSIVEWQKHYGTDTTREHGVWLEITSDGGYIIAGSRTYEKNISNPLAPMDSSNIFLMKTDANGNLLWSKEYDSGGDDVACSVQITKDGGYILSAFTDSAPISVAVNTRAWLIKTDNAGNVEWEGKYEFACRDALTKEPFTYVTKQTLNKGFIIVGTTISAHIADFYVIRLDSAGQVDWAKSYDEGTPFNNSGGYDVIEVSDSTFIVTGFMDKDRPNFITNNPVIFKLDQNGNIITHKGYDWMSWMDRTGFSSVIETSDNKLVFCGNAGYGATGWEFIILKTDLDLNMIWSRHYDHMMPPTLGGAKNIQETNDGGFILSGMFMMSEAAMLKIDDLGLINCRTPNPILEYVPPVNVVNWNPDTLQGISVVNWNPPLANVWEDTTPTCSVHQNILMSVELKSFSGRNNGDNNMLEWTISSKNDLAFFTLEHSVDGYNFEEVKKVQAVRNSTTPYNYETIDNHPYPLTYYRLKKTFTDGSEGFSKIIFLTNESPLDLNIYPNPTSGIVFYRYEASASEMLKIVLTDFLGNKIISQEETALAGLNSIPVDMTTLPAGTYMLHVHNVQNSVQNIKVIKQN